MNLSQLSEQDRNDALTNLALEHQVLGLVVKQLLLTNPVARAAVQNMADKSEGLLMQLPLSDQQIADLQAYLHRLC